MVSKLKTAVTNTLNSEFGDNYKIHDKEIKQGLKTPCFFVFMLKTLDSKSSIATSMLQVPFNISYLGDDLEDIAIQLLGCLKFIEYEDLKALGKDMEFSIEDEVLSFNVVFDLFYTSESDETIEPMETIDVDMRGGNR